MNEQTGKILNCGEIKIALLVITHTIAPANLLSSPKSDYSRLQSVLNAATRLIFSARRSDHTTPLLR